MGNEKPFAIAEIGKAAIGQHPCWGRIILKHCCKNCVVLQQGGRQQSCSHFRRNAMFQNAGVARFGFCIADPVRRAPELLIVRISHRQSPRYPVCALVKKWVKLWPSLPSRALDVGSLASSVRHARLRFETRADLRPSDAKGADQSGLWELKAD